MKEAAPDYPLTSFNWLSKDLGLQKDISASLNDLSSPSESRQSDGLLGAVPKLFLVCCQVPHSFLCLGLGG